MTEQNRLLKKIKEKPFLTLLVNSRTNSLKKIFIMIIYIEIYFTRQGKITYYLFVVKSNMDKTCLKITYFFY